jgi:hypothetical protein
MIVRRRAGGGRLTIRVDVNRRRQGRERDGIFLCQKASLDDAQALVHAKDMSDVIRLHCK